MMVWAIFSSVIVGLLFLLLWDADGSHLGRFFGYSF